MKKVIITTILAFSLLQASGQSKFAKYKNTYLGETHDIAISAKQPNEFTLYIDAYSFDPLFKKGGIRITQDQYDMFISAIDSARTKYEEWITTAKQNDIKSLDKTINRSCKSSSYFMYGGDWNFQFNVNLKFEFKISTIRDTTSYLLLIRTGELKSSSNQFMKVKGFAIIFSKPEEISEFLASISREKIQKFLDEKSKETLFKD